MPLCDRTAVVPGQRAKGRKAKGKGQKAKGKGQRAKGKRQRAKGKGQEESWITGRDPYGDREPIITVASFSDLTRNLNYEVLVRLPSEIPRMVVD